MSMNLQEAFAAAKMWNEGASVKKYNAYCTFQKTVKDLRHRAVDAEDGEKDDVHAAFDAAETMVEYWQELQDAEAEYNASLHHVKVLTELVEESK